MPYGRFFSLRLVAGFGVVVAGALCGSMGVARAQQAQPVPPTDIGRQTGTLSDKLGATDGVVHPQGSVDPGMAMQAPSTGRMPVVPPSAVPGGPSDAKPK